MGALARQFETEDWLRIDDACEVVGVTADAEGLKFAKSGVAMTVEENGLVMSGVNPERGLVEIIELPQGKHPFFIASQFHPEFKSWPLKPHPLFREFISVCVKQKGE